MTLGRFGPLTVDQARARAQVTLGAVAAGDDPAEDRQRQGRPVTVAEVCDWYLAEAEAGRLLGRSHRPIKPSPWQWTAVASRPTSSRCSAGEPCGR